MLPQPHSDPTPDWNPFTSCLQFETAEFLFQSAKMLAGNIDKLLKLWAAGAAADGGEPPFSNHQHLYNTIDAIPHGGAPWQQFNVSYDGVCPESDIPPWMESTYEVYFRDPHQLLLEILANPTFANDFDYTPSQHFTSNGTCQYKHFMSVNWAWKQVVCLFFFWVFSNKFTSMLYAQDIISAEVPDANGAMFVPVIMGSDKTTVSVGMGNNKFCPLYALIGNIHNNIHCGHGSGLVLVGFLAIPKSKYMLVLFVSSIY